MSILPGYDFGVNEIPTRDKLRNAALGLQIDGVSESDLASTVVPIVSGGSESAVLYGTADVSAVWISAAGDIYVREQAGPVKMVRAGGGWESTRYYVEPHVTWGEAEIGDPCWVYSGGFQGQPLYEDFNRAMTGHTGVTDTIYVRYEDVSQGAAQANLYQGIFQDTGASGWRPWSGRGATIMRSSTDTAGTYERYCTINMGLARSQGVSPVHTWTIERATLSGGLNSARQQAHILGPCATTSAVSDANWAARRFWWRHSHMGWNFGLLQMAKKGRD